MSNTDAVKSALRNRLLNTTISEDDICEIATIIVSSRRIGYRDGYMEAMGIVSKYKNPTPILSLYGMMVDRYN